MELSHYITTIDDPHDNCTHWVGKMMKEDYKVDPLSIKVDQTKKDTRRDAWDRDYMGYYYLKEEPKSNKQISNATPVFIFALFYVAILVMIGNIK